MFMYGNSTRMLFQDLPLHQKRGQKHGKPGQAWPGQACQGLAGLPGKRGLEKPSKPGQGQGFEVSLALEAWLFRPHWHFMAFLARKPEARKVKIPGHVPQVIAIRTRNNMFYSISIYLLSDN